MRYFATYLIYLAVVVRTLGWSQDTPPIPLLVWILLALFGVLLLAERPITRRLPWFPRLYTLLQSILVITMLYRAPWLDILTMLFLPLSFQAVQFFHDVVGFAWIGAFSLAMTGMFFFGLELLQGIVMILLSTAANALMGSYAHLMARTEQRRLENQRIFADLQEAYRQLKDSSAQAEALAAAEERHHLVRELHDSLTQTLFSMNLAVQTAQLAAAGSPYEVGEHLTRLQTLARSAAGEVQALTGQSLPGQRDAESNGLAQALRRLAEQRLAQDGLQVSLEVSGERRLPEPVEASLYRIAQEALNNITRHSGSAQAWIRLRLDSPCASLEIEDNGRGFDPGSRESKGGYGITGMSERAEEIGWAFMLDSQPGQGTRVRLQEKAP